jgi:hypothetical protein
MNDSLSMLELPVADNILCKQGITLHTLNDGFFEISSQCHLFTPCAG